MKKTITLFPAIVGITVTLMVISDNDAIAATNNQADAKTTVNLPKLLDLGAHKCIPCKKMFPILDVIKKEYKGKLAVEFVDVWQPENRAIAEKNKIQTIPTQIFFNEKGKEIWRHIGYISKEDIMKKWKELGYKF